MMKIHHLIVPFALALMASNASANYYDRKAEGWFWYQQAPIEVEEEPQEPEKPEDPPVIVMSPPETEPEGPSALSAEWFRVNLQGYIDKAIDEPTDENIEAYFLLQRVMMDKAQAFAEASQRVVSGDPLLDESVRRSLDPASASLQDRMSKQRREETLKRVLDKSGVAFFFSEQCDLCSQQATILSNLSERTGMTVLPVSIDGSMLPNGLYADSTVADTGQAENLSIDTGLGVFLLIPPETWVPLSYAPTSQDELVSRILEASVKHNLITQAEFDKTRPLNIDRSLAGAMHELQANGGIPEDPAELIKLLRAME